MVKFGGHVEALREGDLVDAQLYLVPYNTMKVLIQEHGGHEGPVSVVLTQSLLPDSDFAYDGTEQKQPDDGPTTKELFIAIWKKALKDADEDFHKARGEIWQTVFSEVAANDDAEDPMVRGAHPGNAIKHYADLKHSKSKTDDAQELLARMKEVHRAASVNSEALRKLVKKYDKHRHEKQLSSTLLPLLYTSSLYSGQNMIFDSINLLRDLLSGEYDDSAFATTGGDGDRPFNSLVRQNSQIRHQESVDIRMMEFKWLKNLVQTIPARDLLPKLVSHRGFHSTKDRNDKRPVENSLSAYEMAWTCGIEMCECDIALTKDEKLILAHDEDFFRLSLDNNDANSKRKVSDLTFKEIISMPLSNGVRPPLLIDVLRSASAISERSKLIIEIKPGNQASAFALARLLIRHPDLRSSVAMIMSFDAATMHQLRAELDHSIVSDSRNFSDGNAGLPLHEHRRMTSYDHFGTMSTTWLGAMGMSTNKLPSFGTNHCRGNISLAEIGLSISQNNLSNAPSANTISEERVDRFDDSIQIQAPFAIPRQNPIHNMPKLMLLTVADPPNIACELQVQCNELHRVDNWLKQDDGILDGVYLQFQKEMMTPKGADYLREMSQRFMVGIWQYADRDPDNFQTFEWLIKRGNCSFINTDLPKDFREDLVMKKGGLPPLP